MNYPTDISGWVQGAFGLERQGQSDAALCLLNEASKYILDTAELAIARAYIVSRTDKPAAAAAWSTARKVSPHLADGWCQGARHAAAMGDVAAAKKILAEARGLLPNEPAVIAASAYLAEENSDWEEASNYWDRMDELTPASEEVRKARRRLAFRAELTTTKSARQCLALILKVKDDVMLMKHWIAYHAAIVGEKNLTVLDCGSSDPEQLSLLSELSRRLNVVQYDKYYDQIHTTRNNVEIYERAASGADYVGVLDADEYLFGVRDGVVSTDLISEILRSGDADIYAGTWFPNTRPPAEGSAGIDWSMPIEFASDKSYIEAGTISGKALVSNSCIFDIRHLGHNLRVKEVVARITRKSFGRIGIFHVHEMSTHLNRARIVKHLRSRRVLPEDLESEGEIVAYLEKALSEDKIGQASQHYAARYVKGSSALSSQKVFRATLLPGHSMQSDSTLAAAIDAFDFETLLSSARTKLGLN